MSGTTGFSSDQWSWEERNGYTHVIWWFHISHEHVSGFTMTSHKYSSKHLLSYNVNEFVIYTVGQKKCYCAHISWSVWVQNEMSVWSVFLTAVSLEVRSEQVRGLQQAWTCVFQQKGQLDHFCMKSARCKSSLQGHWDIHIFSHSAFNRLFMKELEDVFKLGLLLVLTITTAIINVVCILHIQ